MWRTIDKNVHRQRVAIHLLACMHSFSRKAIRYSESPFCHPVLPLRSFSHSYHIQKKYISRVNTSYAFLYPIIARLFSHRKRCCTWASFFHRKQSQKKVDVVAFELYFGNKRKRRYQQEQPKTGQSRRGRGLKTRTNKGNHNESFSHLVNSRSLSLGMEGRVIRKLWT